MARKVPLAILAVLVLWQILDFLIHVVILGSSYAATLQLWRQEDEMKYGLMLVVGLISAAVFVLIYARLIAPEISHNGRQIRSSPGTGFWLFNGVWDVLSDANPLLDGPDMVYWDSR